MELRPEERLILSCIKIHSTPEELEQMDGLILQVGDWEKFVTTVIDRGIGPLFYKKLPLLTNSSLIPVAITTKLQQAYYKTFSRSTYLYDSFRKVAEEFNAVNIPVIALKGIYLSEWLYSDIGLRQFSDIDLLVKEEDGERSLAILSGMGYIMFDTHETEIVKSQNEIVHYSPMILNGVSIEIHIKLHIEKEHYHLPIDELWKNAIHVTISKMPVFALNFNDLLIHLCIHLDKHFRSGHVQFTCFNDITNLLDKYKTTIDWNDFIDTCRKYSCENIVFLYIVIVYKYMNAPVPESIQKKYASLLTKKDEQLFLKYLNGHKGSVSTASTHLVHFNNMEMYSAKFKYFRDVIFPSRAFMMIKYKIKRPGLVFFYYLYRWGMGVKGLFSLVGRK